MFCESTIITNWVSISKLIVCVLLGHILHKKWDILDAFFESLLVFHVTYFKATDFFLSSICYGLSSIVSMRIEGMPLEVVRSIPFRCKNCLLKKHEVRYIQDSILLKWGDVKE